MVQVSDGLKRSLAAGLVLGLVTALLWQPSAVGQGVVRASGPALMGAAGLEQVSGPVDAPPVRSYPATEAQVQGWIDAFDMPKIRAHGWDLWQSITSDSGRGGQI